MRNKVTLKEYVEDSLVLAYSEQHETRQLERLGKTLSEDEKHRLIALDTMIETLKAIDRICATRGRY